MMTRLEQAKPFGLHMPMVAAATPSISVQSAIDRFMTGAKSSLRRMIDEFLTWLTGPAGRRAPDSFVQRRFTVVRLRFNALLTQFDLFADVLTQRSEHEFGVWLAGLDALAKDALHIPGAAYQAPPVVCYLDRGVGAAIRRARTRLPGGAVNPVSIIRVPRERLIGSAVASSIIHEVGHQGAALLDLVASLRSVLAPLQDTDGPERVAWRLWHRWISEIIADFWSIAHLGVSSTIGLTGVVNLPRAFVFRIGMDDPHPAPWVRVRLSAAIGAELFPDPQWARLTEVWERLYPRAGLRPEQERLFGLLDQTMPDIIALLVEHRPRCLGGQSLAGAMPLAERTPETVARAFGIGRKASERPRAPQAISCIGGSRPSLRGQRPDTGGGVSDDQPTADGLGG